MTATASTTQDTLRAIRVERLSRRIDTICAESASYGCLMAMVDAKEVVAWAKANIDADSLVDCGIETEPHVTVLYGFKESFEPLDIRLDGPISFKLGAITRFECPDKGYDVIKFTVESEQLRKAHTILNKMHGADIKPSQYAYNPHLTLAYVKCGSNLEIDGCGAFKDVEFSVNWLEYSAHDNKRTIVPLNHKPLKASAIHAVDVEVAEPWVEKKHNAIRNKTEKIYQRAAHKLISHAEAQAIARKKIERDDILFVWLAFLSDAAMRSYAYAAPELAKVAVGEDRGFTTTEAQEQAFAETRTQFATKFPETVRERLETAQREAETTGEVNRTIHQAAIELEDNEGARVATTESQAVYGAAQTRALILAGFKTKVWQTQEDERVRESHNLCQDQGAIAMGTRFHNGLMYPGDPDSGPEEVVNCRCFLFGGSR